MFSVIRRAFASTAHELGAEIGISSLKSVSSTNFYKLDRLNSFQEAEEAPEGSVVVDLGTKTQFQKNEELIQNIHQAIGTLIKETSELRECNVKLTDRIEELEADIKVMKLTPAVIQICETMKKYQMVLIQEFLPDIFSVLSERNKKFSFLKGKPSSLIKTFLKQPVVVKLDSFISTKEFKKILEFRNLRAHEAVSDINLLSDNFDNMIKYFRSISKEFDNESIDFDEIREVHEIVQKLEQKYEK